MQIQFKMIMAGWTVDMLCNLKDRKLNKKLKDRKLNSLVIYDEYSIFNRLSVEKCELLFSISIINCVGFMKLNCCSVVLELHAALN